MNSLAADSTEIEVLILDQTLLFYNRAKPVFLRIAPPLLTSVALMEAEIVAENILQGNVKTFDYRAVPSILFTDPILL